MFQLQDPLCKEGPHLRMWLGEKNKYMPPAPGLKQEELGEMGPPPGSRGWTSAVGGAEGRGAIYQAGFTAPPELRGRGELGRVGCSLGPGGERSSLLRVGGDLSRLCPVPVLHQPAGEWERVFFFLI